MILTPPCSPDVSFARSLHSRSPGSFLFIQIFSNMRSYMNLAVLALTASTISTALSAPIQYRCGNLLVEFDDQAFPISEIPLGSLGWIPISFVESNSLVSVGPLPISPPNLRHTPTPREPNTPIHLPHTPPKRILLDHQRSSKSPTRLSWEWLVSPWSVALEPPHMPEIDL